MGQVVPTSQNLRDYIEMDVPEENMINNANMCQKITHQSDFQIFRSLKKNIFQWNFFGGLCYV